MAKREQYYKFMFTISLESCVNKETGASTHPGFSSIGLILKRAFSASEAFHCAAFQLEVGQLSSIPHIQGCCRSKNKFAPSYLRKYLFKAFAEHSSMSHARIDLLLKNLYVEPCYQEYDDAVRYCIKDSSRYPHFEPYIKNPDTVYLGQDIPQNLYPWQTQLLGLIEDQRNNNRQVLVLFDSKGGIGKSVFIKKLLYDNRKTAFHLPIFGTGAQLCSALASTRGKDLYLLDLPRTQQLTAEMAATLESLRNGLVSSPYFGKATTLLINPPTVLLMCNTLPELKHLSIDRWLIYQPRYGDIPETSGDAKNITLEKLDTHSLLLQQEMRGMRLSNKEERMKEVWLNY